MTMPSPRELWKLAAHCWISTSLLLLGCGKTSFNSSEQNGNGSNRAGTDANATKGTIPYGTPPSNDIKQAGWSTDIVKSLVDGLVKNSSLPGPGGRAVSGGADASASSEQSDGLLWLPCRENTADGGTFPSDFYANKGSKVRVAGEFCPTARMAGDITVLFVIDHSGSMEGAPNEGPNDQTTNGSCGRLRAAETLVKTYSQLGEANVQAGVVGFSTLARVQVPIGRLDSMQNSLKADVFCGSDSIFAFTNYQAAFTVAESQIAAIPGPKVVYFISDGSPTVGGAEPRQAGLNAANALRAIPDVTLYALFVGYSAGKAGNPQNYLEQLTGNANLVRVTSSAVDLAQAASTLGTIPIGIDMKDTQALLENAQGSQAVQIESLVARKDAANRYIWTTAPFELHGTVNGADLNKLTVTTVTSKGDKLKTVADIRFHEK